MGRQRLFSPFTIYYWLVAAVLFLPIILLIIFSFNDSVTLVFPLKGFTWKWYQQLMKNFELIRSVRTSLLLGVGSSLLATAL